MAEPHPLGRPIRRGARLSARPLTICAVGMGSSVHVARRARWFADRGHRVVLLTSAPSPSGIPGVVEVDLTAEPLLGRPRHFRGATAIALLRAIHRYKPDVVHVHYAYSYLGWLVALFGSRPLVVTVYGGDVLFEQAPTSAIGEWLTVRLFEQADYITTQSNFLRDAVNRLGDFGDKTERILWGVSLEEFSRRDASALRRKLGLRPEAPVILSPKILQPFYRIDLVVEAMAIVRRRVPDAVLVLSEYAADPAYRERLAERIAELDLGEHVMFSGVIPEGEIPAYYSLAELSIAVPPSDGLPQALLESMACETPQILTRLPRYEEIVHHEESAYFVDPDPESVADGIVRLLEDEELRSGIAQRGRKVVEEAANVDEQAARVERRLQEIAATVPRRTFSLRALVSAALAGARAQAGNMLAR